MDPIEITMNPDGSFDLPAIHVAPYVAPIAVDPPVATVPPPTNIAEPSAVVGFNITQVGNACAAWDQTTGLPAGTKGTIDWGDTKTPGAITVGGNAGRTLANGTYAVTVAYGASSKTINITVPKITPPPSDSGTPPSNDAPADPAPSGGVYAQALAGLVLPLASAWSDTRPAYSAQGKVTIADGSVLTCDTSKQTPDYVPYAGIWIYPYLNADDSRHPDLSMACYADCVHAVCNNWVDGKANYAGHHTLTINGAVVEDVDARYDFETATAPCRQGLPQVAPTRNWDPKYVPNYGKVSGGYTSWADQLAKADNGINGRSLTTGSNGMGDTGSSFHIGILPAPMVPWLADGGDENWNVVRTIEDHAWCWPVLLRDRVTGLPAIPCLPHCRDVCRDFYLGQQFAPGHINPVVTTPTSPMKPDNAHCPGFGIAAYLATGLPHDLESVLFWAGYECYWASPAYRGYDQCISQGQVRGVAWTLRSKGYAATLCPADHPLHDGLQAIDAANAAHFTQRYCGPDAPCGNPFGIVGGEGSFAYAVSGMADIGVAPWQQDYLASAVYQNVRMGRPGWDDFMAFLNTYTAHRMGDGSDDALWWTTVAFYQAFPRVLKSYTSKAAQFGEYVADWATFNRQNIQYNYVPEKAAAGTLGPYASQADLTIDKADFGSGPGHARGNSGSPDSYAAIYQSSCMALGADHPAWQAFAAKILPNQVNYAGTGQFNILPEAA
jgi:hypothetical protein